MISVFKYTCDALHSLLYISSNLTLKWQARQFVAHVVQGHANFQGDQNDNRPLQEIALSILQNLQIELHLRLNQV